MPGKSLRIPTSCWYMYSMLGNTGLDVMKIVDICSRRTAGSLLTCLVQKLSLSLDVFETCYNCWRYTIFIAARCSSASF